MEDWLEVVEAHAQNNRLECRNNLIFSLLNLIKEGLRPQNTLASVDFTTFIIYTSDYLEIAI